MNVESAFVLSYHSTFLDVSFVLHQTILLSISSIPEEITKSSLPLAQVVKAGLIVMLFVSAVPA